jgi:hypothetical protein
LAGGVSLAAGVPRAGRDASFAVMGGPLMVWGSVGLAAIGALLALLLMGWILIVRAGVRGVLPAAVSLASAVLGVIGSMYDLDLPCINGDPCSSTTGPTTDRRCRPRAHSVSGPERGDSRGLCAAILAIWVPLIGHAAAIGVSGAVGLGIWQDAFGLLLSGWLLGNRSRQHGYFNH